jgi:oxygen-dependent protoporphyrinogen oxidase
MKRLAIIGGGISVLSAAFALEEQRRSGAPLEYVLFESSLRLGGVLVTERVDGCLVEAGPDSFLTEKPWAADLCRQVGLEDQLIGSNDTGRKTYILVKGRLVAIPDGLMFMVPTKLLPTAFSPLFPLDTKLRMAREWFHSPRKADRDETVASLVERHYGAEMVDRLADPLLSGVYGGEACQLSVRAVLPRLAEMEASHGSLGRAMLAARKKMAQATKGPAKPLFISLQDGMQQMVDAVLARLSPAALRPNTTVQFVQPQNKGWLVSEGYGTEHFDAVIVATPAPAAAALLQTASAVLACELREIPYSSSVTATLGYNQKVRSLLPPGFGFLVPRREASACWLRRLCTISFRTALPKTAHWSAVFSGACVMNRSSTSLMMKSSTSSVKNFARSSVSPLSPCSPASISGKVRWRSMPSAILNGWSESKACASSCPDWPSPATDIGALACPIVCVPAGKQLGKRWPQSACPRTVLNSQPC